MILNFHSCRSKGSNPHIIFDKNNRGDFGEPYPFRPASHKWCGPAWASANAEFHPDLHCLLAVIHYLHLGAL